MSTFLTEEHKQLLLDGYFDIEWSDDVSELRCVHCHRVAISHNVSSCQHIFCNNCSKLYSDEEQLSNCPRCQEHISQPDDQDFDFEVKIHQLRVFCPNKKYGCNYADQLRKIPSHLMNCVNTRETAPPGKPSVITTRMNANDIHSLITNNECHLQMTSSNVEETKVAEQMEALQEKKPDGLNPQKSHTYKIRYEATKNIFRSANWRSAKTKAFTLTEYRYNIRAKLERDNGKISMHLQFNDGDGINELNNIGGFIKFQCIVKDQSNTQNKKDITSEKDLSYADCFGNHEWIKGCDLPDAILCPPYFKDNQFKFTLVFEPLSINRSLSCGQWATLKRS